LDSNIVYLDTVSGNDANSGASEVLAKKTYASAVTAASTTKKIRVINSGAAFTANITKPTEMKRGLLGTITGSALANIDNFAIGASGAGMTTTYAVAYCPSLGQFIAVGTADKAARSSDTITWTNASSHGLGGDSFNDVIWIDTLRKAVAVGGKSSFTLPRISYSSDLNTWTEYTTGLAHPVTKCIWVASLGRFVAAGSTGTGIGYTYSTTDFSTWQESNTFSVDPTEAIYGIAYSTSQERYVIVTSFGRILYSDNLATWTEAATPSFSGTLIRDVCYASSISKFIAVGDTGKIAYSTDGDTWTQAGTPSFGATNVSSVRYFSQLGYLIAAGGSGKVAYSTNGNVWTQCTSDGSRAGFCMDYSEALGKVYVGGAVSEGKLSDGPDVTISASIAGFTVSNALLSGNISLYSSTFDRVYSSTNGTISAIRVSGNCSIVNNTIELKDSLVLGDLSLICVPSSANAVRLNSCTIAGKLTIANSSSTFYEQIRDNIVEGGVYASNAVIVTSGNIRGTRTNATCTRSVSFSDPVFVDTTDYKLQRVTNGDAQDSPLVNASAYYVNEQGQPRDFGAWSYDDSTLSYEYKRSFYLLKPSATGIRPEKQPAASADQGLDGTWDAVNEPTRATEYLTLQYGSGVPADHITAQDLLESLTDLTCEISLDPHLSDPDTDITVNGAHSVGDCVLNIDASTTIKAGMVLTIGSYKYYILYCYPSTSPTKLVLHQALLSSVADNLVITPQEPTTYGTYQYIPQSRQIPRQQSNETEYVNGALFKFVRQYPQL
jgi:hypothetical protein